MSQEKNKIRLFINLPINNSYKIELLPEQVNYVVNVMRRKIADEVVIFNGMDGEWLSEIEYIAKKQVTLRAKKQLKTQKIINILLAVGFIISLFR